MLFEMLIIAFYSLNFGCIHLIVGRSSVGLVPKLEEVNAKGSVQAFVHKHSP